jgi:hypothetical protein
VGDPAREAAYGLHLRSVGQAPLELLARGRIGDEHEATSDLVGRSERGAEERCLEARVVASQARKLLIAS